MSKLPYYGTKAWHIMHLLMNNHTVEQVMERYPKTLKHTIKRAQEGLEEFNRQQEDR